MASYSATLVDGIIVDETSIVSSNISNVSVSPVTLYETGWTIPLDDPSFQSHLPVIEYEIIRPGTHVKSFLDDYYYRIHIDPASISLPFIASPIDRPILIWNAYFVSKNCSQFIEVNGVQWSLTGATPPFDLAGLDSTSITVHIKEKGTATFEGSITFDFTSANQPILYISGTRVLLFRWRPQSDIQEILRWKTKILAARDKSDEQRIALRSAPRQSFKYPIIIEDDQNQARFDAEIFGWQKRIWAVPIWPEFVRHLDTINANDTTISFDTTDADYREDGLAVIWQSPLQSEVVQLETVTPTGVTLSAPVQNTYTGLKLIMPCRSAQIPIPITRDIHTVGPAMFDVFFEVLDNLFLSGFTPPVTYKGVMVLANGIFVDPTQSKSNDSRSDKSDYETGKFIYYSDTEFNQNLQNQKFYNDTKSEAWQFRLMLHSLRGQQKTFFVPTQKEDMKLDQGFSAVDTDFNIVNIGLSDNMGVNTLRTDIAFIFPDGIQLYREVTGLVKSGTQEIVSIDAALGIAVEPGDCIISFLDKVRLASDEVNLTWGGVGENESTLQFEAIKA